jgi:hypothetical protein
MVKARARAYRLSFLSYPLHELVTRRPRLTETSSMPSDLSSSTGRDTNSMYELGTTIAVSAITTANLFVGLNSR